MALLRPESQPNASPCKSRADDQQAEGAPTLYLVLSLAIGTFLVFAQPPGQGLDEVRHFYRVWTFASGAFVDAHGRARWTHPTMRIRLHESLRQCRIEASTVLVSAVLAESTSVHWQARLRLVRNRRIQWPDVLPTFDFHGSPAACRRTLRFR